MGTRPFILLFLFCALSLGVRSALAGQTPPWKALDGPQAACERPLALDVGEEFFFEIANEVPGQHAYNELVALYHRKKWELFDEKLQAFRKAFENSPLLEPVTYLEVQTLFDRITHTDAPPTAKEDGEPLKKAEKALRDALLLYPKSKLAPVVSATAAIYWLRTKRFQRALSFFEASAEAYPDSGVECLYRIGMGEASFWLGDWRAAEQRLSGMLDRCRNFRLRTAAELRLAESRWQQNKPGSEAQIEKIIEDENPYIERFYPSALFNYGEMKYRTGDWKGSRYYFDRFLKKDPKATTCTAEALKRLADIALMLDEPLDVVAGKYLAAHDAYPLTETGRFAYAHALLLTLTLSGKVEYARRIKVVDDVLDKIKDGPARSRLFLEKGLAMLSVGEFVALDYLANLKSKQHGAALDHGEVADYVRNEIAHYVDSIQDGPPADVREFLEQHYESWLRNTVYQALAWRLYEQASVRLFADRIENGKYDDGFELLDRWKSSDFWPRHGPSAKAKDLVSVALLKGLFATDGPDAPLAIDLLQRGNLVRPFLDNDFDVVEVAAASQVGDERRMKRFYENSQRQLASVSKTAPNSIAGAYLMMAKARALRDIKEFSKAEVALALAGEIKPPELLLKEKMALYSASGDFQKAYPVALALWGRTPADKKIESTKQLYHIVSEGKLWKHGDELLGLSQKAGVEGKDLAPFYFLAARSYYEKKQCGRAIQNYESALHLDPDSTERAEGRYRLGKCLFSGKKREAAKQQWEKVVQFQDAFWSPLAKNELKLLAPKR